MIVYISKVYFFLYISLISACHSSVRTSDIINNISKGEKVDLDTCKTEKVDFYKEFITHKNFDHIDEKDTIYIAHNLISVKTSRYFTKNNGVDNFLSQIKIYYNEKLIFSKDSILTTGMFYFEKSKKILSIPIIVNQNIDDLTTETVLYICDLNNESYKKINHILINSSFALICSDGKTLIFNNRNELFKYNIINKEKEKVVIFNNPIISIYKIKVKDNYLEVFYFKNFSDDIINDIPMKKSICKLQKNICNFY